MVFFCLFSGTVVRRRKGKVEWLPLVCHYYPPCRESFAAYVVF